MVLANPERRKAQPSDDRAQRSLDGYQLGNVAA